MNIKALDAKKNTNYTGLLYTYLVNERKSTDTAKQLHMHRNNVIYHIDRLAEKMGIDLDDPEERLRLMLTYKAMELV